MGEAAGRTRMELSRLPIDGELGLRGGPAVRLAAAVTAGAPAGVPA